MLEIFTVGGGEYIVNVLNAVAAWTGGGGFRAMLRVVMVMGLAYVLLVVAFSLDWRAWFRWFLGATLMYGALIVPTTGVKVTDRIDPALAPATVANVPIGLAALASVTSQFGDWLTRTAETVFVMPNALQHSTNGIIYGARLYDKTLGFEFRDPRIRANVGEYYQQCLFYDLILGFESFETIANSTDILADMGPGSPARAMNWFNKDPAAEGVSDIITCADAYQRIIAEMPTIVDNELTRAAPEIFPNLTAAAAKAKLQADLPVVMQMFHGSGDGADRVMQQRSLASAFLEARANLSEGDGDTFAMMRAEAQARNTYMGIAQQAMTWVPLLNIVLTVVFYAMFPVIFPLFLLPQTGVGALKGYMMGFFYLAAWGPLYVVLHMFVMSREAMAMNAASPGGVVIAGLVGIEQVNADTATIAGFLLMSVPFLAAGLARGAVGVASNATSMLAPAQSAAEAAAIERTTGNYAYGNVSYQNLTGNVVQRDQWNTAPTFQSGAGSFGTRTGEGAWIREFGSGDGFFNPVYDTSGAISNLGFSAFIGRQGAMELRQSASERREEAREIGRTLEKSSSTSSRSFTGNERSHVVSSGSEARDTTGTSTSRSEYDSTSQSEDRSRSVSIARSSSRFATETSRNDDGENYAVGVRGQAGVSTPGGSGGGGDGGLLGFGAGASVFGSAEKVWRQTDSDESGTRSNAERTRQRSRSESDRTEDGVRNNDETSSGHTDATFDSDSNSRTSRSGSEHSSEERQSLANRQAELLRTAESLDRLASYAETHNYRLDENAIPLIQPLYDEMRRSGEVGPLPHLANVALSPQQREARNEAISIILERLIDDDRAQFIEQNGLDRPIDAVEVSVPAQLSGGPGSSRGNFPEVMPGLARGAALAESGIRLKATADVDDLHPQMVAALPAIRTTADRLGLGTPVVTSGNDSRHIDGSRHYRDEAVDLRANTMSVGQGRRWAADLQSELGSGYTVLYEYDPQDPQNRHLHVQMRG